MIEPTDSSIDYIFGKINDMTLPAIESIDCITMISDYYRMKTIRKILGVDVNVNICVNLNIFDKTEFSYYLHYKISGKNSYVGEDLDMDLFYSSFQKDSYIIPDNHKISRESVKDLLVNMHNTIPALVINIERSGFTLPIDEGFGSIYTGGEECSVCLEKTTILTVCKHSLCMVCYSHMQKYKCSFKCPICREVVHYKYDECDDEE